MNKNDLILHQFDKEAVLQQVLGVRSAVDLAIPTGVDAGEIFKFQMRTKRTAEEVVRDAATAVGAANAQIAAQYGNLFIITEELYGFTRQGETSRSMTPRDTEYTDADAIRSDVLGSMLPLASYHDALGWTKKYLQNAVDMQLNADIQLLVERWINRFDYQLFTRMLTNTENAIGSAGWDVPWAIGTGTNVNYIPPAYYGAPFSSSHTHFVVKDDSSDDYDDLIEAMITELRHHGFAGRAVLWVNETDLATVSALTNWTQLQPVEVQFVGGNTGSPIAFARGEYEGLPGTLAGYYRSQKGLIEVRYHPRIPQKYAWMTIPAGANSANAPFAIRVHPDIPFGMTADPELTNSINPKLKQVNFEAEFGLGVNNRLRGVAGYIDAGATVWVNPTTDLLGGATEL